ncbi:MAG: phosphodiesterase [Candidatus Methanofastidiosum methylothiophilum]|uniref:Phosphodiesterase n=1 Tax=Candidatus Methanofastidiosum methylothiophilum TaxID=1705564 RepID=A0A150ITR2_9EURY|nr:MAG: phosphodiesterase [Candidatus Methanofastidiosum methylthiophilus]KYC48322.1 MAG: phosphodiesterase [Candidatus Methanofastidiosum methylthiophilus]KYC50991.1 MAG: phosphodiesterase [Candidatus Methanofastidiosum methylthiophilus]
MSDVHGNIEALLEVLKNIESQSVDKIICTGDLVGYGPYPNEVVDLFIDQKISSTLGNHDVATFDMELLNDLGGIAHESIMITLGILGKEELNYLKKLPRSITCGNFQFVHASPPDNVRGYITRKGANEIIYLFSQFNSKICFIGHTHLLAKYYVENSELKYESIGEGRIELDKNTKYIINVGSVGQPRDGIYKAKYVIFDENSWSLEVKYVDYDIKKVQNKILELGFPKKNAEFLGPI